MNMFSIFLDARQGARWHYDGHMKLILEAAQMASAVYWCHGQVPPGDQPYRLTHRHHPCVRWACQAPAHFFQVLAYGLALSLEYRRRYRPNLAAWHAARARRPAQARRPARAPRAAVLAFARRRRGLLPRPGRPGTTGAGRACWTCWPAPGLPAGAGAGAGAGGWRVASLDASSCLAFQSDPHLFSDDVMRSYRAYYALKYVQGAAGRWGGGQRARHGPAARAAGVRGHGAELAHVPRPAHAPRHQKKKIHTAPYIGYVPRRR